METLSLVPWVENKIVSTSSWFRERQKARRRVQEYEQMMRWTMSSLQVSTEFDWGHTCEIAMQIDACALRLLETSVRPTSFIQYGTPARVYTTTSRTIDNKDGNFVFCSRTLLSRAMGKPISSAAWLRIIEFVFAQDSPHQNHDLLSQLVSSRADCNGDLIATWILSNDDAHAQWLAFTEGEGSETVEMFRAIRSYNEQLDSLYTPWYSPRDTVAASQFATIWEKWEESPHIDEVKKELTIAQDVMPILEAACRAYSLGTKIEQCCDEHSPNLRKRALATGNCKGLTVTINDLPSGRASDSISHVSLWAEMRDEWRKFVGNWAEIIKQVSKQFPFPQIPGIDGLILHDMVTGYVGSTKVLRNGGKCTGTFGTTIVHPTERAAVVSSQCQLVRMQDSAVDRHGLRRKFGSAADEFARYALLRCDLVKPDRMNFKDAVRDWEAEYTKWDRCPSRLSEWGADMKNDFVGDNYRIVLLRQAMGLKRSIHIAACDEFECSVFGGFLPLTRNEEGSASHKHRLIVDRPLTITVGLHARAENVFNLSNLSMNSMFVKDRWGCKKSGENVDGYYMKQVLKSGRPSIFRLSPINLKLPNVPSDTSAVTAVSINDEPEYDFVERVISIA